MHALLSANRGVSISLDMSRDRFVSSLYRARNIKELLGYFENGQSGSGRLIPWLIHRPEGNAARLWYNGVAKSLSETTDVKFSKLKVSSQGQPTGLRPQWASAYASVVKENLPAEPMAIVTVPVWIGRELCAVIGLIPRGQGSLTEAKALAYILALAAKRLHALEVMMSRVTALQYLVTNGVRALVAINLRAQILAETKTAESVLGKLDARKRRYSRDALPLFLSKAFQEAILEEGALSQIKRDVLSITVRAVSKITASIAGPLFIIELISQTDFGMGLTLERIQTLSGAERKVFDLVLLGMGSREIASRLHSSAHTVRHHVSAIFRKLGFVSRYELLAAALNAPSTKTPLPVVPLESVDAPKLDAYLLRKRSVRKGS